MLVECGEDNKYDELVSKFTSGTVRTYGQGS